jgi:hypothetical protein
MKYKNYWKEQIEDILYMLKDKYIYDMISSTCLVLDWVRFRTCRRYHIVNTGLEPGYYDTDTRMLHVNFNLLVDFVEIEKAWMNTWSDDSKYSKLSWFGKKFRRFRSPEDGISYLNWEIIDCQLEEQSKAAKEVLELYTWWKTTRPNRPDPYVEAGYYEVFKYRTLRDDLVEVERDGEKYYTLKKSTKQERQVFKKVTKIEAKYDKEDEQMLIRLVKIRKFLWT